MKALEYKIAKGGGAGGSYWPFSASGCCRLETGAGAAACAVGGC